MTKIIRLKYIVEKPNNNVFVKYSLPITMRLINITKKSLEKTCLPKISLFMTKQSQIWPQIRNVSILLNIFWQEV